MINFGNSFKYVFRKCMSFVIVFRLSCVGVVICVFG